MKLVAITVNNIPSDIDEVIREVTPVTWLDNPLPRPQHVVTDNYSPTSPVYNPDHSPIQIDSDDERRSLEQACLLHH